MSLLKTFFVRLLIFLLIIFMGISFYRLSRDAVQRIFGTKEDAPVKLLSLDGTVLLSTEALTGFNPIFAVSETDKIHFTLDGKPFSPKLFLSTPLKKWLLVLPEDFGPDLQVDLCLSAAPSYQECFVFKKKFEEKIALKGSAIKRPFSDSDFSLSNFFELNFVSSEKTELDVLKKKAYDRSSEGHFFEAQFIAHSYFDEPLKVFVTLLEKNFSVTQELKAKESSEIVLPVPSLPYGTYHLKLAVQLPNGQQAGDTLFTIEYLP